MVTHLEFESGIYDGEKYDARLEWAGWDTGEFDGSLWRKAVVADWIENPKNMKILGKALYSRTRRRAADPG